jgi:uncharacterized protein (DUF427 family)
MENVTAVKGGIHRPDEPRHFMRLKRPEYEIVASCNGVEIARSNAATKLQEAGFDLYDPVIYFPRSDVKMDLLKTKDKSTHCPLKGDTEYFDLDTDGTLTEDAAWSYNQPVEIAMELKDLVAFDTAKVQIIEYTVVE